MASHLLPLTLSVTVVIDVRHAYIITLPALFINPSDYLTVTFLRFQKSYSYYYAACLNDTVPSIHNSHIANCIAELPKNQLLHSMI